MHTIQMAMPDSRLRSFVRCFAQREISGRPRRWLKPPWPSSNTLWRFICKASQRCIIGQDVRPSFLVSISLVHTRGGMAGPISGDRPLEVPQPAPEREWASKPRAVTEDSDRVNENVCRSVAPLASRMRLICRLFTSLAFTAVRDRLRLHPELRQTS